VDRRADALRSAAPDRGVVAARYHRAQGGSPHEQPAGAEQGDRVSVL